MFCLDNKERWKEHELENQKDPGSNLSSIY